MNSFIFSKAYTSSIGFIKPAIKFNRVVLPHPEGPIIEQNSPLAISKLKSLIAM